VNRSRQLEHPAVHLDGESPYAANLCPIPCGGAVSHTRLRTTILHSEGRDCKRYLNGLTASPGKPPGRRFRGLAG
jgi:hypothetical protein